MKLFLLFAAAGFLAVLLQTTILHALPLGGIVPDLALILCVYWGLNHPNILSVVGSFVLGYTVDVFSGSVPGLNAFALSLVFLLAHLGSRHIWLNNAFAGAFVVFLASWVKVAALIILGLVISPIEGVWLGVLKYVFLEALFAALLAPALFALLKKTQTRLRSTRAPLGMDHEL